MIEIQKSIRTSTGARPSLGDISLALPFSSVMSQDQVNRVCRRLRLSVQAPHH
jgi:hypothetical protein